MTYIIKDQGMYCHSEPRFKRAKPEGGTWTEHKASAKQFDTKEEAQLWLKEMRAKQKEAWPQFRFQMRGFPIQIKS